MTNISLDNPYLLLLAVPLFILVLVPYLIAIRKENKSKSTRASLIIHTIIVLLVSVAFAGLHKTTIKTTTEVIVVADVSYSTGRNADKIDNYIKDLIKKENLPENTKTGVVCFGKNVEVNTPIGGEFSSVKNSKIDNSGTDIAGALNFASTLFSKDSIKRIVLITDGKETINSSGGIMSAVNRLESSGIYIDAIYTDSNLKSGDYEVQLVDVEYTPSTYLNNKTSLKVLVQSNTDYVPNSSSPKDRNDAFIRLYDGEGNLKTQISEPLHKGFNMFTIDIDTTISGTTDYRVEVEANHDTSNYNNTFLFSQTVNENLKVLLITTNEADIDKARELYGENAQIDSIFCRMIPYRGPFAVPYSIEELCAYDEFILSDVDIKDIDNAGGFLKNLDIVVSKFGKSLITIGNTHIQNQSDPIYQSLDDMLAIKYGNTDGEPKLYALVIDASRSMQGWDKMAMAKTAAIKLLDFMQPHDYVMIIAFWGEVSTIQRATPLSQDGVSNKGELIQAINSISEKQGTVMGAGLRVAYEQMVDQPFFEKQVLLISDGKSYESVSQRDNATAVTNQLYKAGINTSAVGIHTTNTKYDPSKKTNCSKDARALWDIADIGKGKYYPVFNLEEASEKVSTEIAEDITESKIETPTKVLIQDYNDSMVTGISALPDVGGFYYGKVKSNTTVVLSAEYKKSNGGIIDAPLYAYWSYGNGKVTTISTTLTGNWSSSWISDEQGSLLFSRIVENNVPKERIDHPFNFDVTYEDAKAIIDVLPAEVSTDAIVDLEVITPTNVSIKNRLFYEAGGYRTTVLASEPGLYRVNVSYSYGEESYSASTTFYNPYSAEYNDFDYFDSSSLQESVGNVGKVSLGEPLVIENDKDEVETYVLYYTANLMVIAVALYVIDIIVRKIKWSDIKSLFKFGKNGGKAK